MDQSGFYCKNFVSAPPPPPPMTPGPGWSRPGELTWGDELLERSFRRSRGGFYRSWEDGGFSLAYPLNCRLPFPLPPLFCFVQVQCLGGRGWWVFSFGPGAVPRFPSA